MLFSLKGKTALVTGASRGIGHSVAETLSAAGAEVFGVARSPEPASPYKSRVAYVPCDITDKHTFSRICERMYQRFKSIDILVNSAGISLGPDDENRSENFEKTLKVNLTAAYEAITAVAAYMKKNKKGSIINIISLAGIFGMPENPGYVAGKGGLRMLSKGFAVDLAEYNIRVNNIIPGYILTAMTEKSFSDENQKKQRDQRILKNRWGRPEDLAGAVLLLASDASDYITGTDIFVDGGWAAKGL